MLVENAQHREAIEGVAESDRLEFGELLGARDENSGG